LSLFNLIATAAGAAAPGTPAGQPQGGLVPLLIQMAPIILGFIVLMWLMNGSKRKQERERLNLLSNLKRGDKIRMIGGEFGAVIEVKDNRVQVKVDESSNTKIWYAKDAVQSVEKESTAKEETK
jgi:preprotein translocase YajC subunit